MKKVLLFLFSFLIIFIPVKGEEFTTTSVLEEQNPITEEVDIDNEQKDSFNMNVGDNVNINKEVNGSGLYLGQKIKVNKNINGIAFLFASDINIDSNVENGLLVAKNVTLSGTVDRDLFVASTSFKLSKDAKINRDLFLTSKRVELEGTIERDAFIVSNIIIIKSGSIINSNVRLRANNITIEDNVTITGTLKYNEDAFTNIKNKDSLNIETYMGDLIDKESSGMSQVVVFIYKVVSKILLFFLLIWLFPRLFKKLNKVNEKPIEYAKNLGVGVIILVLTPLLSLFLLVLPYTTSIGILSLIFYFITMYLSLIVVGYLLGELLREKLIKKQLNPFISGMFGILLVQLLTLIPGVYFLIILIGYGTSYMLVVNQEKEQSINVKKLIK